MEILLVLLVSRHPVTQDAPRPHQSRVARTRSHHQSERSVVRRIVGAV